MPHPDTFRVRLEGPAAGAITLRIYAQRSSYVIYLSAVPADAIAELVSALLVVAQSGAPSAARFYEEPDEAELCFERAGDQLSWTLYRLPSYADGRVERQAEVEAAGQIAAMIRPFWKALRDLQTRYAPEEYAQRWNHPFPTREMELLTSWMQAHH